MRVKGTQTHSIEVELDKDEVKELVEKELKRKFKLPEADRYSLNEEGFIVAENDVKYHNWDTEYTTVRKATKLDKAVLLVLEKL